jgi:uncharacterized delta-60 repeat protein
MVEGRSKASSTALGRVFCLVASTGLLAAFGLLLLGPTASTATGIDGRLDPSFGEGGREMLPMPFAERFKYLAPISAMASDGSLYIGNNETVRRIDPGGTPDPSFAGAGTLTPAPPSGGKFEITGLAVDSRGRLVVAGTSTLPAEESDEEFHRHTNVIGGDEPLAARIARYLPAGSPDPSFGSAGMVETTLGLEPPLNADGTQLLSRPWVKGTGVAVDAQDRIVLTGAAAAGMAFGCAHDWFWNDLTYAAFVARFEESGRLDPTFATDGILGAHTAAENPLHLEVASSPTVGPDETITYRPGSGNCPSNAGSQGVGQLEESGAIRTEFGGQGATVSSSLIATAVGPDGSLVVIEGVRPKKGRPEVERIRKLTSDGRPDPSFGEGGRILGPLPATNGGGLTSVVAEPGGGVLIAGVTPKALRRGKSCNHLKPTPHANEWVLMRLGPGGRLDPGFGQGGLAYIRFPGSVLQAPRLYLDPAGRAVSVGRYWDGTTQGVAVARYLLSG